MIYSKARNIYDLSAFMILAPGTHGQHHWITNPGTSVRARCVYDPTYVPSELVALLDSLRGGRAIFSRGRSRDDACALLGITIMELNGVKTFN